MALLSPPWACRLFQGTTSHGSTGPQMHSDGCGWEFVPSVQLHVFYMVCQRFTSLSASGLLPGLRELPALCELHHSWRLSSQAMF